MAGEPSRYFDFVTFALALRRYRASRGYRDVEATTGLNPARMFRAERGIDIGAENIQRLCTWMHVAPDKFLVGGNEANWRILPDNERREWRLRGYIKHVDMAVDDGRHVVLTLKFANPIYRDGHIVVEGGAGSWLLYGTRPNGVCDQLAVAAWCDIDAAIQVVNQPQHMEAVRKWEVNHYPSGD